MKKQATKTTTKTAKATVAVPVTPAPKSKKNAAEKVAPANPVAVMAEPVSKRVTVGAVIAEWRVVRSQRKTQPGWFVQGGNYSDVNGRECFTVGCELHFADKAEAQAALAARKQQPAAA